MKFFDALSAPGFGAIAEFKRRSPSAGDLRPDGDVAAVARSYERAGARAMSVLVDERFDRRWQGLRKQHALGLRDAIQKLARRPGQNACIAHFGQLEQDPRDLRGHVDTLGFVDSDLEPGDERPQLALG